MKNRKIDLQKGMEETDREEVNPENRGIEEEYYIRESQPAYMPRRYTVQDYYALPEERRVELINGVFYEMLAPDALHQDIVTELGYLFRDFMKKEKGKCKVYVAPLDVQLDHDAYTIVQPDVVVLCDRNKIVDHHIMGAPDLVIEVLSPSTKTKDMGIKLYKYKDAGVREYWIVDPKEEKIFVYDFENNISSKTYMAEDDVPVGIYNGKLKIRFCDILKECWK